VISASIMVSVSHTGSSSRTCRCERMHQKVHGSKLKQRQKLHQKSSFIPVFVLLFLIALLTQATFFLPVDKFSMDGFQFQDNRDQQNYVRNGFRESTASVLKSDGKEEEMSAKILKSEYGELVGELENTEEDAVGKFGNNRDSEDSQQVDKDQNSKDDKTSTDAKNQKEEAVQKLVDSSNKESEDKKAQKTEDDAVEKLGNNRDSEDSQQVDKDQNSEDDETSTGTKNSEEEAVDEDDMYFRDPNATVADWPYFPSSRREPRRDPSWTNAAKPTSSLSDLNKEECDLFMGSVDTSPPPLRKPSDKACDGYDGVFQINHYDGGAASGTAFFLFTIGMLAWADQHNYLPWIHIEDNFTKPIWDPIVHTNIAENHLITFEMISGMEIGWARDPDDPNSHIFPGKPFQERDVAPTTFVIEGTGVWEHYFLPPNDFVPGDSSCRSKPIVKMNDDHIVPGIHSNAPWAPRAWRYVEAPNVLLEDLSWDEWFKPQRKRGAEITDRYIRFNPMMERRARCDFPNPEFSLGMHIRHGDKHIERDVIETDTFLAFAEAFVDNGGGAIFVATDSAKVIKTILENWPKDVADHVVHQSSVQGLTSNKTAAFDLGISSHRTNVEALTDVLALSKSTFFLHGLSAMSEAVLYLNPGLVARSINLEDEMYSDYRPEDFVEKIMPLGKTSAK